MDIDKKLHKAAQSYWDARARNKEKQIVGGKIDAGTRGEVTGGSQMGGRLLGHDEVIMRSRVETGHG